MLSTRNQLGLLCRRYKLNIGAELGVATGNFSLILNNTHFFKEFYCIDKWNDHHTEREKELVIKKFINKSNVTIIHSTFTEAAKTFPDSYFDFIYIDGYAHTGQDNGVTLREWFPKLKKKGLYAGHDYCSTSWPKTFLQVNKFLQEELGYKIHKTRENVNPSWYILK